MTIQEDKSTLKKQQVLVLMSNVENHCLLSVMSLGAHELVNQGISPDFEDIDDIETQMPNRNMMKLNNLLQKQEFWSLMLLRVMLVLIKDFGCNLVK